MIIAEYDDVDPLGVLHLNLLSLGFALTPERAALIRQLDPRPFPFFALYAVEDERVAGQVGVFRLPVVTTDGPDEVGGLWAVCTHPAFSRRGISTRLMDEAHARMRAGGLRFSTLGTSRHRGAYALYHRQGYEDAAFTASLLARRDIAQRNSSLRAETAGLERLPLADGLFQQAAAGRLGFAWRHPAFLQALVAIGDVDANEVWLVWHAGELAGYALAKQSDAILVVSDLLLCNAADAASAVAALVRESTAPYVRVSVSRSHDIAALQQAGYQLAQPDWGTFMVKPLSPEVSVEDARRLFGIDTDRFVQSWIDIT